MGVEKIYIFIEKNSLKLDQTKKEILKILYETDQSLSADEIKEQLLLKFNKTRSSTYIHRFLSLLCVMGLVKFENSARKKLYFFNVFKKNVILKCCLCLKEEQIYDEQISLRSYEIGEKHGYHEHFEKITIYGICKDCNRC